MANAILVVVNNPKNEGEPEEYLLCTCPVCGAMERVDTDCENENTFCFECGVVYRILQEV